MSRNTKLPCRMPRQHLASHRGYKLGLTYTSEGSLLGCLAEKRVKRQLNF